MSYTWKKSKTIFNSIERLIQDRTLNGVVDLYGLMLTKEQIDKINFCY
jgi:hypothetical protein